MTLQILFNFQNNNELGQFKAKAYIYLLAWVCTLQVWVKIKQSFSMPHFLRWSNLIWQNFVQKQPNRNNPNLLENSINHEKQYILCFYDPYTSIWMISLYANKQCADLPFYIATSVEDGYSPNCGNKLSLSRDITDYGYTLYNWWTNHLF